MAILRFQQTTFSSNLLKAGAGHIAPAAPRHSVALEALEALHACSVTINRLDVPQAQKICQKMDCFISRFPTFFNLFLISFWDLNPVGTGWGRGDSQSSVLAVACSFSAVARYHVATAVLLPNLPSQWIQWQDSARHAVDDIGKSVLAQAKASLEWMQHDASGKSPEKNNYKGFGGNYHPSNSQKLWTSSDLTWLNIGKFAFLRLWL